ncbi:Nrap protein [Dentipellis sp. KUC8613]|nr:Nrap protein [Dentipellis sp. KUC8613]
MAQDLKRKRAKEADARGIKKRQLSEEPEDEVMDHEGDDVESAGASGSGDDEPMDAEDGDGEDEDWGGIDGTEEVEAEESHHAGGKPKKPPTGEEVRSIKEATELFRSSSFKLQIDALLPNVRPKESRKAPLERFLLALHECILSAPSIPPRHPLEAARALLSPETTKTPKGKQAKDKGKAKAAPASVPIAVPYPLPLPTEDANWKVAFEKPSEILLVGSWANQVSVKAKDGLPWGVDVAVEMPSELFQEKDYLNGRFFHKRAFYIAAIARHIASSSKLNVELAYESANGDPRLTNLVLRPKNDDSPNDFTKLHAQVRIIPVLPSSSPIPLSRLAPHRSNFRVHNVADSSEDPAHENLPTPLYNTTMLLSATPKPHLLAAHALKQEIPSYVDALALLRIWANQRGYGEGKRMCISGFEGRGPWWSAVLEMLAMGEEPADKINTKLSSKRRPLGKGLSSYQLFKAALDFLARYDFANERIFVKTKDGHRFPAQDYYAHHDVAFVDSPSLVNLLAGVPLSSLAMLQHDAKRTLQTLDSSSPSVDPFTEVFLKENRDLFTRFDAVMRVDLSSSKLRHPSIHATLEHGSPAKALFASLDQILRAGLGPRVKALSFLHPPSESRPLTQAHPSTPSIIYIGLVFDPEHAFRLVDHGPAASETESEASLQFRELWGDKAELRRFKDGRIVESVVWDVKTADEKAHIPVMVVKHLLSRHFHVADGAVQSWQPAFDALVRLPESISTVYQSARIPAGFKGAMTAFDDLVKTIKSFDKELPLAVLNVSPVSEYLRYTSVFAPVALLPSSASLLPPCGQFLPTMEVILEFERSARWPDDLAAIQKTKLAFLERIAAALMEAKEGTLARVVVSDALNTSPIQDQASLEIVTPQGWAFAARIWHDREATLLDRIINESAHVPKALQALGDKPHSAREREEAREARELYVRRFVHAPRHHRAVAALCHRFAAFAGTVRLVKRWLAAHWLLRGHVAEEAVEILCAHVFVGGGGSETVPGSKERGFAAVVEFFKDWDWTAGLFVPLYEEKDAGAGAAQASVVVTAGHKGVWTIATDADKDGHMWTANGPDNIVALRVKAIAKATWDYLQQGAESGALEVKTLLVHPVDDYDFVVQLEPSVLPRYTQNVVADPTAWARKGKFANLQRQDGTPIVRPGFDPAQLFLDDVKRVHTDTLRLFYDPIGGDRFGAVWDPSLKQPRPFRVMNHFSSIPIPQENEKAKEKEKSLVTVNESAVLSEILRMGAGLVKS